MAESDSGRDRLDRSSQASPGPWQLAETDDPGACGGKRRVITSADNIEIMDDLDYYPNAPVSDADWHMIAAAPEMRELLTELEWSGTSYFDGGSQCPSCGGYPTHEDGCQLARVLRKAGGES
jgi:hypothetical protein